MGTSSDNGARPEADPAAPADPADAPSTPASPERTADAEAAADGAEAAEGAAPPSSEAAATGEAPAAEAPDPEAQALDEVRELLGDDLRLPTELPRGYRPSDSVREPLFRVELSDFAGPLDLLLYLIRKHQVDVLDIPIKFITTRYLEFLDGLRALQIDVASEFLVLAAELTHIKSKMLLPAEEGVPVEDDEAAEEGDPRAELVRRLLEYQKYRDVALQLDDRDLLGRDVFPRVPPAAEDVDVDPGLKSVSIFKLVELMARMLRKAPVRSHEIAYETYSISERIDHVFEFGRAHGQRFTIGELLATVASRAELVVTFIAVLEMTKLGMVKLFVHEERAAPEAEPSTREPEAATPSSAEAHEVAAPALPEAAVDGPADEAAVADEDTANDEEPLPTIWIHLTGKTRDSDLVDDYRG